MSNGPCGVGGNRALAVELAVTAGAACDGFGRLTCPLAGPNHRDRCGICCAAGFLRSGGYDLPALAGSSAQSERTEAGQVDRGGEQGEVGGDLGGAAHSGAAPAVAAAHQVTDLAFHFRAGRPVVGDPGGIGLGGAGAGQFGLIALIVMVRPAAEPVH